MADLSPTIRQRELGLRLREFRTAKGMTVEEVAKELLLLADQDQPRGDWRSPSHAARCPGPVPDLRRRYPRLRLN